MATNVVKKKMSVSKKITITLASILAAGMLLVCAWWLIIYLFGPTKYIEKTFNWDYLTTTSENKEQILKIKYNSNKNKNGLEMFEMDWTYFQDETKNSTYSQGLQYIAISSKDKIDFAFTIDEDIAEEYVYTTQSLLTWCNHYNAWGGYKVNSATTEYYNYQSSDGYRTTTTSTNPLGLGSKLKIELGQDRENTYLMTPKGLETPQEVVEKSVLEYINYFKASQYDYYCYYDYNYLAKIFYESIKGLAGGTKTYIEFELGNYFDYYKYDASQQSYGEKLTEEQIAEDKVLQGVKSYCVAYIEVSDDGAQDYSDSMFNMIKNNSTFNLNPDRVTDDYFTGRTIIKVDEHAFDYVTVYENYIALKLKDSFVKEYLPKKDSITLDIEINLDNIKNSGHEYFGLATDSGLKDFNIKSIHTVQTQDGHQVKTEVQL